MQYGARFHVDFSETEGNLPQCTISFTFPSVQSERNGTFFYIVLVSYAYTLLLYVLILCMGVTNH